MMGEESTSSPTTTKSKDKRQTAEFVVHVGTTIGSRCPNTGVYRVFLCMGLGTILVLYITYSLICTHTEGIRLIPQLEPAIDKITEDSSQLKKNSGVKLIIDWTSFFGGKLFGSGLILENSCAVKNKCAFTNDKSLFGEAAAIVFHLRDIKWNSIPQKRFPHQRYVFFLQESPVHSGSISDLRKYGSSFFNWTMTYRLDSDIPVPYTFPAKRRKVPDPQQLTDLNTIIAGKNKSVVWMVSNCHTDSKRELYIEELKKYIDVDVFGGCGTLMCDRSNQSICETMIKRDYRFYIAFENSVCRDYVTEKMTRMWNSWAVPIVLNDKVHRNVGLPNDSYIAADRFLSAKQLADHLHFLIANPSVYRKYFLYREYFEMGIDTSMSRTQYDGSPWCRLCQLLFEAPAKRYDDIVDWWTKDACEPDYAQRLL